MTFYRLIPGIFAFSLLAGCVKDPPTADPDAYALTVPSGFPAMEIPTDNSLTRSRVELGKRLFFDPALSRDSTLSCATCHRPHLAFADSLPQTPGIEGRPGTRNAPTLANVGYLNSLLREGGVPTLEMQVLVPIQEHNEFDFNILEISDRLNRIPEYVAQAQKAYDRKPDAFVITRAIAAFERTLVSGNSPFDYWFFQNKTNAVSASVKRGYELFQSEKTGCGKCHSGFLFSNQDFANNGLYETYADPGRFRLTGRESDLAVFKIPTLRHVAITAPYMHDGSLPTLDAVLDHYQSGGKNHPNKSHLLRPFGLTPSERADMLAFLHSLTDQGFLNNPEFRQ